jgi:hypothetical protein
MSNEPKTENPAIEENLQTIEKNNTDKLAENETVDKDKLRVTYDVQTVDTKIKASQK